MYFFVPKAWELEEEYSKGVAINKLFGVGSVGIITARDKFTIHEKRDDVEKTILTFLSQTDDEARLNFKLGKDVRDWKVSYARKDLKEYYPDKGGFVPILYRPFDQRWTFFTGNSKGFHCMPRKKVMQHFIRGENLGLVFHKREELDVPFSHIFVARFITEHGFTSSKSTCYVAPLYLYNEDGSRELNLNEEVARELIPLCPSLREGNRGEKLFYYIYAVLHSLKYRTKFSEF